MKHRKLKADKIFDGFTFFRDHVLIVQEDGVIEDIVPKENAGEGVETFEGIISPGFINCHCHLELSHMKGHIPEKTGLVDFVFKVVTERHHKKEEILNAIAEAEAEMIKNGIVAVGDICNNALTLPQKTEGRLQYYNFIEASGWLPSVSQERFERAKESYNLYANSTKLQTPNFSIVPHAPYSVSANLWQKIKPYFENKVVSIHNQETSFEDDFFLDGTGDFRRMYQLMNIDNAHHAPTKKSSLQSYFDELSAASSAILVHNTFTRQEDVDFIKSQLSAIKRQQLSLANKQAVIAEQPQTQHSKPKTFFCLCVNANQYIEGALPPIDLLRNNNCTIVLGTDSLASNWSLSIVDEIKTLRKHFPHIALSEFLQWATINGARALQMDDRLGSFEKKKRPGVNILNEERLSVQTIF